MKPDLSPASLELANGSWELRFGDCLSPETGMCTLPDKSVDHVITDPPYSRDLYARARTNKGHNVRANGRPYRTTTSAGIPFPGSLELASLAIGAVDDIMAPVAEQIRRLSRRWMVVFHDVEISHRWRAYLEDEYLRLGAWVKTDPMPQITGDRPAQGFEACTIAHPRGRKRWNGGGKAAAWIGGTSKGDERPDHPCPKPEWLMEQLVRDFTDPGDLILDPFAGSGTTGVAAIRLGRRFIGWERDPKYHAIAVKRLTAAREQLELCA